MFKYIVGVLLLVPIYVSAENYYVDALSGRDDFSGTEAQPFRTIQKAADVMVSGDVCLIKRGIYRETVVPKTDGLTFKSFDNEYVLITGLDVIEGWEPWQNSIVKTSMEQKITQMFVDGKRIHWARYPDQNGDMFDTDDMAPVSIQSTQPTGPVTFPEMDSKPDNYWAGGYFVGLATSKNWWTAHRGKIESSKGNTINAIELSYMWKEALKAFTGEGQGYIIGHLNALDTPGEWHWQDGVLYLMPPGGSVEDKIIEARTRTHGFNLTDRVDIRLEGLHFKAADIHMPQSERCVVSNCTVRYPGVFSTFFAGGTSQREAWGDFENGASGIYAGGNHNLIKDSYIGRTWTHGVTLWGDFNTLENCVIEQANWMGERASPVFSAGNDNKILWNTIRDGGRDGIELGNNKFEIKYARRAVIKHNHVYDHGHLSPDSGLLYTNHQGGANEHANTEIAYNVMHDFRKKHGGIYLDNGSSGYSIHHNLVWNSNSGVHINDFKDYMRPVNVHIYNNTFYDTGIPVKHSYRGQGPQIIVKNNLANNGPFNGTEVENNLLVANDEFRNHEQKDFALKSTSTAIDTGLVIDGITDNANGRPDVGAFEHGGENWAAGSSIEIPEFIDETGGLADLPDNSVEPVSVNGENPVQSAK